MTKHLEVAALALLVCLAPGSGQDAQVKVKVRVVLVDKDLNQKPVPFVVVRLKGAAANAAAVEAKTDLNGAAQVQVVAGHYNVSTAKAAELGEKSYIWNFDTEIRGGEQEIDLTNDNAKVETAESGAGKPETGAGSDLTSLFGKFKNSIVKVRGEAYDGSGFVVDASGLIVTNNHVVESSKYLAVQFDQKRKVAAQLVASNRDKDVAVLWANPAAFPEWVVAPIVPANTKTPIVVGQQVFTIGNPLGREKVLTTGVISKVDTEAITSDISINPGNSGGPLFTMGGQVAGITTAYLRRLASIVPIEYARPLIEQAKQKIANGAAPSAELLPVEPEGFFPADALRPLLQQEKMDMKPYNFELGQFRVWLITPQVGYFSRHEDAMAAARKAAKRAGGDPSQAKPPSNALEDAQDYQPVLVVSVRPRLGIGWSHPKFKNGFEKLRLLCGGKEIAPIDPGRGEYDLRDERGRTIDTTFQGRYTYLPDAVSPACGGVVLEIYSEKEPNTALSKTIEPVTTEKVWADFEPFRKSQTAK